MESESPENSAAQSSADAQSWSSSQSDLPSRSRAFHFPYATIVMLAVLIAMFVVELLFPVAVTNAGFLDPTPQTLIAVGGLFPHNVQHGEWYRVFTCAFLHGGPVHLLFNGVALWMAGVVLESLVGRVWFLALFFLGALGGSLMSLATNDGHTVSVGASGAIMALFSAAIVLVQRLPEPGKSMLTGELLRVLIPSLLPILQVAGVRVDFGAHLGGALTGFLFGGVLYFLQRGHSSEQQSQRFRQSSLGYAVAALGAAATVYGFAQVQQGYLISTAVH